FRELGWEVEAAPRLARCQPQPAELEAEAERVAAEIPDGSDVLIGGLGYLCDALALRLLPRRCHLWCALTYRVEDSQGRFVFTGPTAVVETPLSVWYHARRL
ncbi:MAG: hypothetical protein N3B15_01350, partial [Planctomycetota bacterium]|nr:hypothetical protein [Planctomycetota bacterium]